MARRNTPEDVFAYIEMRGADECWPWHGAVGGRETEPRPYFKASGRRTLAYRWVYELVHGVTLTRDDILLHSCDNGRMPIGCCNPAHVRLGTVQENSDDMTSRQRHGIPHHTVRMIRRMSIAGQTDAAIAEMTGMARRTINSIVNGDRYAHVTATSSDTAGQEEDVTPAGRPTPPLMR